MELGKGFEATAKARDALVAEAEGKLLDAMEKKDIDLVISRSGEVTKMRDLTARQVLQIVERNFKSACEDARESGMTHQPYARLDAERVEELSPVYKAVEAEVQAAEAALG